MKWSHTDTAINTRLNIEQIYYSPKSYWVSWFFFFFFFLYPQQSDLLWCFIIPDLKLTIEKQSLCWFKEPKPSHAGGREQIPKGRCGWRSRPCDSRHAPLRASGTHRRVICDTERVWHGAAPLECLGLPEDRACRSRLFLIPRALKKAE